MAGAFSSTGAMSRHLPPSRRNIAMVFQSYALFPHLSVAENIVFGLKVRKVAATEVEPAARARRPICSASRRSSTASHRSSPAASSSAWHSAARSSREAPVCLMDEPLSNLDAQLRQDMRAEIRAAAAAARHHDGLRHARSGRGDVDGRPGRAAEPRPDRAERNAAPRSTSDRRTLSSRVSSARRR